MPRVTKEWLDHIPKKGDPYWTRVRERAKEINSDGCSKVPDIYVESCYEHDIHWRTGKTIDGDCINETEANHRFRKVIQSRSFLRILSPLSWGRWLGVTLSKTWHKDPPKDCE